MWRWHAFFNTETAFLTRMGKKKYGSANIFIFIKLKEQVFPSKVSQKPATPLLNIKSQFMCLRYCLGTSWSYSLESWSNPQISLISFFLLDYKISADLSLMASDGTDANFHELLLQIPSLPEPSNLHALAKPDFFLDKASLSAILRCQSMTPTMPKCGSSHGWDFTSLIVRMNSHTVGEKQSPC